MPIFRFRTLAAAAVFVFGSAGALAQPPSAEQVRKLFEVTRTAEMAQASIGQMGSMPQQMIAQMTAGKNLSPEEQEKIAREMEKFQSVVARVMDWDKVEPIFIKMYADTFDAQDVQAMIDFYDSPAGRKMVDKTPQLMQNMMAGMQQILIPLMQEMEKELQQTLK